MYSARVIEELKGPPGTWSGYKIGVFGGEKKIGEYNRNYSLMRTFHPFQKDGKWYALYSPRYTATRVMSLPDCTDLGGEEPNGRGFCPVEYYVPQNSEGDDYYQPGYWGFVQGCVWGDDTCWKLQYLDLSRVEEGIVKREERFGYIPLPNGNLKDLIEIDDYRNLCDKEGDALDDSNNYVTFYIPERKMFQLDRFEKVKSHHYPDEWTKRINKWGWGQVWPEEKDGEEKRQT